VKREDAHATGSGVELEIAAAEKLKAEGVKAAVVSMDSEHPGLRERSANTSASRQKPPPLRRLIG
jgi:transketolase